MLDVRKIFEKYGISPRLCKAKGIPYQTAYAHWTGRRKVTPYQAVKYEKVMGISRYEFFPKDFWEPAKAD